MNDERWWLVTIVESDIKSIKFAVRASNKAHVKHKLLKMKDFICYNNSSERKDCIDMAITNDIKVHSRLKEGLYIPAT